jgi:hypothetical protein
VTLTPVTATVGPYETLYVKNLTDDEQKILTVLYEQLVAKTRRNMLRASYYDGKRAIMQVGSVIPPQYYRLGIVLGWSAKAVDILARRCNLDGFVWPDGDLDSLGFREIWDGNHLGTEVSSALISSLIHGTSFLVNTQGDEEFDEAPGLIHVKDALSSTGLWNPRTRRLDAFLSISSRDDKGRPTGFALYLHNVTIIARQNDGACRPNHSSTSRGWVARSGRPVFRGRSCRSTTRRSARSSAWRATPTSTRSPKCGCWVPTRRCSATPTAP